MRFAPILTSGLLSGASLASAQVNAVIVDGSGPFAEGILNGYIVQSDGKLICSDPFVIGRYISCDDQVDTDAGSWRAERRGQVHADTNGTLGGMIVVDAKGRVLCSDPTVSIRFRGPESYILCND